MKLWSSVHVWATNTKIMTWMFILIHLYIFIIQYEYYSNHNQRTGPSGNTATSRFSFQQRWWFEPTDLSLVDHSSFETCSAWCFQPPCIVCEDDGITIPKNYGSDLTSDYLETTKQCFTSPDISRSTPRTASDVPAYPAVLPLPHEAGKAQRQAFLGVHQATCCHVLGGNGDVLGFSMGLIWVDHGGMGMSLVE